VNPVFFHGSRRHSLYFSNNNIAPTLPAVHPRLESHLRSANEAREETSLTQPHSGCMPEFYSANECGRRAKPSAFPESNPQKKPCLDRRARGLGAGDARVICQNSSSEISRLMDLAATDGSLHRLQLAAKYRRNACIRGHWPVVLLYIVTFGRTNKPTDVSRTRSSRQARRMSYCLYPLTSSS
jgi:hypothetical protein